MSDSERADLLEHLRSNPDLRKRAIQMLARDYSSEFLAPVKIDAERLSAMSATAIRSDKEWQE
jgi:hypothetical protein